MKITIESTDVIATCRRGANVLPAREWRGETESGVPVRVLVATISPQTHDADAIAQFERELQSADDLDVTVPDRAIDPRFIL